MDPDRRPAPTDPRMRGFRARWTVGDLVEAIDARVSSLGDETVALGDCAGRVLAVDIVASVDIPHFDRAAMDGYALRGEETFGSDAANPALFRLVGRARPGRMHAGCVGEGEGVEVATGAPMPTGADAVAPVETASLSGDRIEVVEPVPPGRHVGRRGEDVCRGDRVFTSGRVLRPQDLGMLSALGLGAVRATRRPVVVIIITGDELLPAGTPGIGHRIGDMNSVMLAAMAARDGGRPRVVGPLPDDRDRLRAALVEASQSADLILVSGGSSTGPEDHAPSLLAELGTVLAHGVALRPASPSGFGLIGTTPVVLLPGNPVSCLCAYDFFGGRAIRRLGGRPSGWAYRSTMMRLAAKVASALGRVDYVRVRIAEGGIVPVAAGGASILSSVTKADGFVVVPADSEGYQAGTYIELWFYDNVVDFPIL